MGPITPDPNKSLLQYGEFDPRVRVHAGWYNTGSQIF